MITSKKRSVHPIQNAIRLRNTKSQRTKNLAKKSLEVSIQCELDIIVVIYDKRFNRYKEICTNPDLTVQKISEHFYQTDPEQKKSRSKRPKYKRVLAGDIVKVEVEGN